MVYGTPQTEFVYGSRGGVADRGARSGRRIAESLGLVQTSGSPSARPTTPVQVARCPPRPSPSSPRECQETESSRAAGRGWLSGRHAGWGTGTQGRVRASARAVGAALQSAAPAPASYVARAAMRLRAGRRRVSAEVCARLLAVLEVEGESCRGVPQGASPAARAGRLVRLERLSAEAGRQEEGRQGERPRERRSG